jgi:hypothetical protein
MKGTAPVVDFVNGLAIDARGIGRNEWRHRFGIEKALAN